MPQHQSYFYILYTVPCLFETRVTTSPNFESIGPRFSFSLFFKRMQEAVLPGISVGLCCYDGKLFNIFFS